MDFNTLPFLCFFAVCALAYYGMPSLLRPYLLLAASYVFYCWDAANRAMVGPLLAATAVTWLCGLGMARFKNRAVRALLCGLSAAVCMGMLFFFKYRNFFGETLNALSNGRLAFAAVDLLAPLGLSYFIFQSLGYALDCWRRKYPPILNPLKYALFVSFFPCIFTGPIERADHLLPQLCAKRRFSYDMAAGGAFRMLWGYFKKMVLADNLNFFLKAFYTGAVTVSGPSQAAAALLFSLRLYFDFSGACDIAIGGARIFGIELFENFDNPFLATSYAALWRRWHKSLTGWFRDYLYYPLGGNRCALWRWAINLMLIFVFSGLWHGAAVGYLYWGLLSGGLVLLEGLPKQLRKTMARGGGRHAKAAGHAAAQSAPASAASPASVSSAASAPSSASVSSAPFATSAPSAASAPSSTSSAPSAPAPKPHSAPAKPRRTFGAWLAFELLAWPRRVLVFVEFSLCFTLFAAALYGAADAHPFAALFSGWTHGSFLLLQASLSAAGLTGSMALAVAIGSVLVFAVEACGNVAVWIRRRFILWRWILYAALTAALLFFGAFGQSAFIYQNY